MKWRRENKVSGAGWLMFLDSNGYAPAQHLTHWKPNVYKESEILSCKKKIQMTYLLEFRINLRRSKVEQEDADKIYWTHRVGGHKSNACSVGGVADLEGAVYVQDTRSTTRCNDSRGEVKGIAVRVILSYSVQTNERGTLWNLLNQPHLQRDLRG